MPHGVRNFNRIEIYPNEMVLLQIDRARTFDGTWWYVGPHPGEQQRSAIGTLASVHSGVVLRSESPRPQLRPARKAQIQNGVGRQ